MKYRPSTAVTQQELKALYSYDSGTGVFLRLRTTNKHRVGVAVGSMSKCGYMKMSVGRSVVLAHRMAWLYVHGVLPNGQLDHINRNKLDNRIANLRECTPSQNMSNQTRKPGASGVVGVRFDKRKRAKPWSASFKVERKTVFVGCFATAEEASAAYLTAKKTHSRSNP